MRKYLCAVPLVFVLCLIFACQDKAVMAELEKSRVQAKLEEQNKEIVKRYWNEKWNERRPEILDELLTPDVVNYGTSMKISGLQEYKQVYGMFLSAFHDTHFTIEGIIAEGDKVMTWASMSGIQKGELEGIPPTGKSTNIKIFTVFRIANGKIAEEWEIFDSLGMMTQLGMELKPIQEKKK